MTKTEAHSYSALCNVQCDACGKIALGVTHLSHGVPVLFECISCTTPAHREAIITKVRETYSSEPASL